MFYTLGTASKAVGLSKPTISEAVKSGKLSANRNDKGHYQIDRAELERVYPNELHKVEVLQQDSTKNLQPLTPKNDIALQAVIDANALTIEQYEARLKEKDEIIKDVRTALSKSDNLLEDKRTEAEKLKASQPKVTRRRVGLWERLTMKEIIEVEEVA